MDACKVVKGLEPKFGYFVTKAAEAPKVLEKVEVVEEVKPDKAKKDSLGAFKTRCFFFRCFSGESHKKSCSFHILTSMFDHVRSFSHFWGFVWSAYSPMFLPGFLAENRALFREQFLQETKKETKKESAGLSPAETKAGLHRLFQNDPR